MKIFLIAGTAQSGKGEIAKFIKEFYIYKLESTAITEYAKYLKNLAMDLSDWDGNPVTKPRSYLQELGKTVRNINPEYFTDSLLRDIEIYSEYVENIVVADVRMPEEIDYIKKVYKEDVYSIYVENQFSANDLSIEEKIDITEIALENYDSFDFTLINDGLDKVKEKLFDILGGLN